MLLYLYIMTKKYIYDDVFVGNRSQDEEPRSNQGGTEAFGSVVQ